MCERFRIWFRRGLRCRKSFESPNRILAWVRKGTEEAKIFFASGADSSVITESILFTVSAEKQGADSGFSRRFFRVESTTLLSSGQSISRLSAKTLRAYRASKGTEDPLALRESRKS